MTSGRQWKVLHAAAAAMWLAGLSPVADANHFGLNPTGLRPRIRLIVTTNPAAGAPAPAPIAFPGLTAANIGTGAPIAGAPTLIVEVGVRRINGVAFTVRLNATVPAGLVSGPNTIPFSQISWTSAQPAGAPAYALGIIPSGTFVPGATTTLHSANVTQNGFRWMGAAMTFSYANTVVVPAGAYSGAVTYTAASP